eukprot:5450127-Prymnesium_polylepis.1
MAARASEGPMARAVELTERVGRVARPRYLLEPAAGGRGREGWLRRSAAAWQALLHLPTADLAGLLAV